VRYETDGQPSSACEITKKRASVLGALNDLTAKKRNGMRKRLILAGMLASMLAFGSGCALFVVGAAAGAGAAGYAYVAGELKVTESATLNRTYDATLKAMKDLEYPVISKVKDALTAHVVARNASDKKIDINLKKLSDNATEVRIRVGTFGDENLSRTILEKIRARL
jgi:hypothetical protein